MEATAAVAQPRDAALAAVHNLLAGSALPATSCPGTFGTGPPPW